MDYDDNFEMSSASSQGVDRSPPRSSNDASFGKDQNQDQIVDALLHRLGQAYWPPYRQQGYAPQGYTPQGYVPQSPNGPYRCGICANLIESRIVLLTCRERTIQI